MAYLAVQQDGSAVLGTQETAMNIVEIAKTLLVYVGGLSMIAAVAVGGAL